MNRSAVTVSLVPEARGGPFVFWDGLDHACRTAAELGFDAIEIFAPGPDTVDEADLTQRLRHHRLSVAAVGTGAGMVKHGLTLTHADADHRLRAIDFVKQMIDFGARFQAPAIIGSMQGRWAGEVDHAQALRYLAEAVDELAAHAAGQNVTLLIEPLNRYETNLLQTINDGVAFLDRLRAENVRLLADCFHMNIEEANVPAAIRAGGSKIGHVHFVDSNRQAVGRGHIAFDPIIRALRDIGYRGYLCAEAFAIPDSITAARQTIESFQRLHDGVI